MSDRNVTPNTATSSEDRLTEIRARLDAASPGPNGRMSRVMPTPQPWGPPLTYEVDKPNADLIAHAPGDIAYLLDRVEKYRAQLEAEGWIVAD